MITGVSIAHPNHCGASPTNARHTAIGRPPSRENITVSTVERTAGIVQTAAIFHADREKVFVRSVFITIENERVRASVQETTTSCQLVCAVRDTRDAARDFVLWRQS
jgi:hypothetical protein